MPRSTERLIELLLTENPTAVNNDDGKPGGFLAKLCNGAADRLRELTMPLTQAVSLGG
jgi:hypothetical protein